MLKKFKNPNYSFIEFNGITFYFKLDLNPLSKELEPHIWIRHAVEPEYVVAAYFNLSEKSYNANYKRWEAFSDEYDIYIYFMHWENNENQIIVISAGNQ